MKPLIFLPFLALILGPALAHAREDDGPMPDLGQTYVAVEGQLYGARPDDVGPLGGGEGYTRIVTGGDYEAATVEQLIEALGKAQPGQVVYIAPQADLDFTGMVFAEKFELQVPAGVTLAGNRGHEGSPGPVLRSDAFQTSPLIRILGPGARVTGLRLRGPDPKTRIEHHRRAFSTGREGKEAGAYYYALPNSNGITTEFPALEVDNCDLSGWSHGAIYLANGDSHHIHHNYIHHNQRNGLGYGVSHGYGDKVTSLIESNVFDYNRHSIAGTGRPGNAYEAVNNVEVGHAIGHYFDMHGGSDRRDATNIAGDWMHVHHNTFLRADRPAVVIRGVPLEETRIHHNWFAAKAPGPAVFRPWPGEGETHVVIADNVYGTEKPTVLDRQE